MGDHPPIATAAFTVWFRLLGPDASLVVLTLRASAMSGLAGTWREVTATVEWLSRVTGLSDRNIRRVKARALEGGDPILRSMLRAAPCYVHGRAGRAGTKWAVRVEDPPAPDAAALIALGGMVDGPADHPRVSAAPMVSRSADHPRVEPAPLSGQLAFASEQLPAVERGREIACVVVEERREGTRRKEGTESERTVAAVLARLHVSRERAEEWVTRFGPAAVQEQLRWFDRRDNSWATRGGEPAAFATYLRDGAAPPPAALRQDDEEKERRMRDQHNLYWATTLIRLQRERASDVEVVVQHLLEEPSLRGRRDRAEAMAKTEVVELWQRAGLILDYEAWKKSLEGVAASA